MNLILSGRGVELDDSLREYATEKLTRIERFFDRIIQMEVHLCRERNPRVKDPDRVEVTVHTPIETLRAHGEGIDHFSAIDVAADRLEAQIKRAKGRLASRMHRVARTDGGTGVGEEDDEDGPVIVRRPPPVTKPLTPEEAVVELESRRLAFLPFTRAPTMRPAVLYRRDSGYGLIEHEG